MREYTQDTGYIHASARASGWSRENAWLSSAQDNSVRNEKLQRVAGENDGDGQRDGRGGRRRFGIGADWKTTIL